MDFEDSKLHDAMPLKGGDRARQGSGCNNRGEITHKSHDYVVTHKSHGFNPQKP